MRQDHEAYWLTCPSLQVQRLREGALESNGISEGQISVYGTSKWIFAVSRDENYLENVSSNELPSYQVAYLSGSRECDPLPGLHLNSPLDCRD